MELSRFLIVANPTSGRRRGRRVAVEVAEQLRNHGKQVEIRYTAAHGEAESISRESCHSASPPDCIVACGGDGTIQEVANALASQTAPLTLPSPPRGRGLSGAALQGIADDYRPSPALGLAPTGRCNDFARAMGVRSDLDSVAAALLGGIPRATDLGRVNGRYFCTVATLGADAEVSSFVDGMRMPLRGTAAYVYGALRVLARYRPHSVRIEGDFGIIDRPLFLASSANTPFYGGNIRIAPQADPADGYLDFCVIDAVSRLKSFALLPKLLTGRHVALPIVHFHRTRRVMIDAPSPMDVWADGERIARTPAIIEVKPSALCVLTPR